MAVEDLDVVDMEVPYKDDCVRMLIFDGLTWGSDDDISAHLTALVRKLNFYLDVAEGEEFQQSYPNTTLDKLTIEIVFRYPPVAGVEKFLQGLVSQYAEAGVSLVYGVHAE